MYPSTYDGGAKYASHGFPGPMNISSCPPPYGTTAARGTAAQWSTGLCHCCDDPANCLITAFCPCVTFGQIAEIVSRGSVSCAASGFAYAVLALTGLPCLYSCFYRSRMRGQYVLEEAPVADCLVHFCCEPCSLCQEYRELKNRGFDMGIGWEANMDRQQRGMVHAPTVIVGMDR